MLERIEEEVGGLHKLVSPVRTARSNAGRTAEDFVTHVTHIKQKDGSNKRNTRDAVIGFTCKWLTQ